MRALEIRHRAVFFCEWCDGVMDSARYFNLLGELVPQVRVSAHALALLGFFQLCMSSDFLLSENIIILVL